MRGRLVRASCSRRGLWKLVDKLVHVRSSAYALVMLAIAAEHRTKDCPSTRILSLSRYLTDASYLLHTNTTL